MVNNRFIDNSCAKLKETSENPISGYEDSPILTLEEAVAKISPSLLSIMDLVATAKKKYNRRSSIPTRDESAAIYLYSMSSPFCSTLNGVLRDGKRHVLKSWFAYLKLLITALEKLPSIKCTVWRGINTDGTLAFVENEVQNWWSVTSCSKALNVIKPYLGENGTLFAIEAVHGKDISEFTAIPHEKEVVLMPGTCLRRRAESLNVKDTFSILHLEEISRQNELYERIKRGYRANSRIERLMNPAKSFSINESYINLSIVTSKDQYDKEQLLHDAHHPEIIRSTFEEIYGIKTVIDINSIFSKCPAQEKQVLVFGRAGIGKSTFCRYITYQWATKTSWSEYDLVVLIPLRRLTANRYPPLRRGQNYSLIDLIKKEALTTDLSEQEERLLRTVFNIDKTLWILDGYDEIVQNIPEHLKYLFEQLLKTPHHLLTSRPYLNTLSYHVQLEITGFTDANIEEYIEKFFIQLKDDSTNNSESLIRYLQSSQSIWGVAHIPVNLELICSVWSNEDSFQTKNLTITYLYNTMTEWLCRRHSKLSTNKIKLTFFEHLAFHAIKSNTVVIRPFLLKKAANEAKLSLEDNCDILNFGILKSFHKEKGIGTRLETNKDHYFIHLSFQEYFAARYLITALKSDSKEKAIEFIKYEKYNQRYTLVFTFVSGLLSEDDLEFYWNVISSEPLDLIGIRHIQLIILCLEASSNTPKQLLERVARCIQCSFSNGNKNIRKHLSHSLQRAPSLVCDPTIMKTLIDLCDNGNMQTKSDVLVFISELKILKPSVELTESIRKTIVDENKDVRMKTCFTLGSISEYTARRTVINSLVDALADENNYVRASASYALGMISRRRVRKNIIYRLIDALTDDHENVRASASYVLERWKLKTVPNKMIDKLVKALGHRNKHVRARVRYYLGSIAENIPRKKMINALEKKNKNIRAGVLHVLGKMARETTTTAIPNRIADVLTSKNRYIRSSACDAFENMNKKVIKGGIVRKLLNALKDDCASVRRSAYEVLQDIRGKTIVKKAVRKLMNGLQSENEKDRRNACEAMKMSNKKEMTKLVETLTDENENVRIAAIKALGAIGENKTWTSEMIRGVRVALRDKNELVKMIACESLQLIGKQEPTNEIINCLVYALGNVNKNVRACALYVLGQMGAKVTRKKVIKKVVDALQDENVNVKSSACCALADFGTKAINNDVIKRLLSVFEDGNEDIRASACRALGRISESKATDEVMRTLTKALKDESGYVRYNACDALSILGRTKATDETVKDLIHLSNTDHYVVSNKAAETVSHLVTSSSLSNKLDFQLISNICSSKYTSICSKNLSVEQLIDTYLADEKSEYLSVIYLLALLQGVAITVDGDKLVIYDTGVSHKTFTSNPKLCQELAQNFINEAKRLQLDFRNSK